MSQILAQHHLPITPEPGGRVPTVAPMELMEQDPSIATALSPTCSRALSPMCSHGRMLLEPWGEGSSPPSLPPLFPNQPGRSSLSSLLAASIRGKVNKKVTKKLYYIYI